MKSQCEKCDKKKICKKEEYLTNNIKKDKEQPFDSKPYLTPNPAHFGYGSGSEGFGYYIGNRKVW